MTTLVVEELQTTLEQDFILELNRRYNVKAVRPYIYMHNAPSGTFTIKIKQGSEVLASKDFTSAEIKSDLSTSDNYAHIYKAIEFDEIIQLDKNTYTIELSSSGYTYSDSSFIGWVRDYENIYNNLDGSQTSLGTYPFGFQLFELRNMESYK